MKFTRQHTHPEESPYSGVDFLAIPVTADLTGSLLIRSGPAEPSIGGLSSYAASPGATAEFPSHWSASAQAIWLEQCFVLDGIACDLDPVAEDDVPSWLWRHESRQRISKATATEYRGEASVREVLDRLVGGWTYHGWKAGYFDSEADARIFHDECRWLLLHQRLSPSTHHWKYGGRHWAYGHDVSDPCSYLTDYRTGIGRRAAATDLPPSGMVINATGDALAGEGGVWDLWRRESEILTKGGNCGVNVSTITSPAPAGSGTCLADILDIGDKMAQAACQHRQSRAARRRITIDGVHPDSAAVTKRPTDRLAASEAGEIGRGLAHRHVQAILDAYAALEPGRNRKPRHNARLRLALQSARLALLPEAMIARTLELAEIGLREAPCDLAAGGDHEQPRHKIEAPEDAVTVLRVTTDDAPEAAGGRIDRLLESVAINAWSGLASGVHFDATAEAWNTCGTSGSIRSASGDGSFMFLDDTAADPWLIHPTGFLDTDGKFDVASYQHAVALVTVAADLSMMSTAAITPRLARRVWDFRPLALSVTGLGQCLASAGVSYDSSAGRAFGAGLCALLTSTAYLVSARLAAELGPFPEYARNATHMARVIDRHSDMVANCTHEASQPDLVEAIEETWSEALHMGRENGFRNAQVSALCQDEHVATLLDSETACLSPVAGLISRRRTQAGYCEKKINPALPRGLQALGYTVEQIDAIIRHAAGHGTLADAPGVNHESLRKRGFTKAAIDAVETALVDADHISMAFLPFVIGEDYCRHMLGFTDAEMAGDRFDMLTALGFSDAGIEAATIYCCGAGTLEGAPHLLPEHLAVFDGAEPQGARGTRHVSTDGTLKMMAAMQPHISGAIGQAVSLPATAPLNDYRRALDSAARLKLKAITLRRAAPTHYELESFESVGAPANHAPQLFSLIQGGQSPTLAVVEKAEEAESIDAPGPTTGTNVADDKKTTVSDAEASRRASSHAARSTASVTSSADAVVEQRHV